MEKENVLRMDEAEIKMPEKIIIGDLEEKLRVEKFIYNNFFANKENWVGSGRIKEVETTYEEEGKKTMTLKDIVIEGFWGKDREHLDVYKNNKCYTYQNLNIVDIINESAKVNVVINNDEESFYIGSDGQCGVVIEYKNNNSIEGISFSLSISSDVMSYEDVKNKFNYLFKCNI